MAQERSYRELIAETAPLKVKRKGGAANLLLTALMVEAGRMLDDGFDVLSIETAAKKAFNTKKGFLSWMDDIGLKKAVSFMEDLTDPSDPTDPFNQHYRNFFAPPESIQKVLHDTESGAGPSSGKLVSGEDLEEKTADFMMMGILQRRFLAVAFIVSVELVDSGIVSIKDVENLERSDLHWKEGSFTLMNEVGVEEAMKMVVEKMELSHRKAVNFPIPRLLITHAQKNAPWNL